jgi:hypothetical protein
MFAALSDVDRARLVRLLGMLNSTFDAERATAGRLADQFIRERNLTWDQIIGAETASSINRNPGGAWLPAVSAGSNGSTNGRATFSHRFPSGGTASHPNKKRN